MPIAENIRVVRGRLESAARRVGRDPNSVTLMAVTKTVAAEDVRTAYDAGLRLFGESRIQEFSAKKKLLGDLEDSHWHMIGKLQLNKAARAAELFSGVDSLDSLRLAEKLNATAGLIGKKVDVLVEINVGGELAKGGVPPDSPEMDELLRSAASLEYLQFRGLMTVPPFTEDPQQARGYFRKLRDLRDRIAHRGLPAVTMDVLSMGMSHDFEIAIEEGSTCVRIGTAIFGTRA